MNTPKFVALTLLTLAIAQFTGCATMKKTSSSASASSPAAMASAPAPVTDEVNIQSTPAGATVSINGNDAGVTPVTVSLDRAQTYVVAVKQTGFYYYSRTLRAEATSSGTQTEKAGLMTATPARFPTELSITLTPVKDRFQALVVAVANLDHQLAAHQISTDAYKQQLAEVTGFYR